MIDLADKIRASGKTKREIAVAAGISERQVFHVLALERNVSVRLLSAIAGALGCDVRLVKSRAERAI